MSDPTLYYCAATRTWYYVTQSAAQTENDGGLLKGLLLALPVVLLLGLYVIPKAMMAQ